MLNRRHLRIKVLQILYAFFQSEEQDPHSAEKELMRSVNKMHDLYVYFLLIFEEINTYANNRIEDRQNKVRPSEDDLNPNKKFVNNKIIAQLLINSSLKKKSEESGINWIGAEKNDLMKKLFLQLVETTIYEDYMNDSDSSFETDKKFIVDLFKIEIANNALLHDFFENESIYWMDDIDLICSMVIKTLKQFPEKLDAKIAVLDLYKDEDDEKSFIEDLLRKTISNDDSNAKMIDGLTQNWELDRIAKMDIILLKMALTELTELTSIPKKVTLNEYIEISKFYSTPKSQVFINGILDKAIGILEKEGKLKKSGRGLIN